jgi:glyoxylase-like metal-dependent hydrolase (beta-lactamase superfamily II)
MVTHVTAAAGGVTSGRVDEVTTRVLAPNPSPMTLDGTNTYLLGRPGAGEVAVVDPGPEIDGHRAAIERAVRDLDASVAAVVVTHHHADHAGAAHWASEWGVPLWAFAPDRIARASQGVDATRLEDGRRLRMAGLALEAVHTPGHAADHVCLRVVDTGAVLAGDHVLGRGTTVLAWPDGDVAAYLASLRRVAALQATRLDPGHGPPVRRPAETIAAYLAHRREREREILEVLAGGAATPAEIVAVVYREVDPGLHPAAERSVRAHLAKLLDEGRVVAAGSTGPDPTGADLLSGDRPQVRLADV